MMLNEFGSKEGMRIVSKVTFGKEVSTRDLDQKKKKKRKSPVLLIANLQHNLEYGIFMMHSKRHSSIEARRQVMQ